MITARIEQKAEELFFAYGLKSISMDDIAREAGVSKKTIYQSFTDKNALVLAIISRLVYHHQLQLKRSLRASDNAIHEVLLITESLQSLILKLKPVLLYDLHKYFPDCWKVVKSFRDDNLKEAIIQNLEKGITAGLYRPEIDTDTVSQFSLIQFSSFFSADSYPGLKFQPTKVIWTVTELVLMGISTDRGQQIIKKYFEQRDNEHTS